MKLITEMSESAIGFPGGRAGLVVCHGGEQDKHFVGDRFDESADGASQSQKVSQLLSLHSVTVEGHIVGPDGEDPGEDLSNRCAIQDLEEVPSNQPNNYSTSQSVNQLFNQSVHQSVSQFITPSVNQSLDQPTSQSTGQSVSSSHCH